MRLIAESIHARNCELLAAGEELYDVTDSLAPWVHPPTDAAYATRQAALRERAQARCKPQKPPATTGRSAVERKPRGKIE